MTQAKQKNRKFTLSSKHILPIAFVLAFVCGTVMMGLSGYSPIAAYGEQVDGRLLLRGLYYDDKEGRSVVGTIEGALEDGSRLGEELAGQLKREAETADGTDA